MFISLKNVISIPNFVQTIKLLCVFNVVITIFLGSQLYTFLQVYNLSVKCLFLFSILITSTLLKKSLRLNKSLFLIFVYNYWRCSWYNTYFHWKWTWVPEFKSWMKLFVFYIMPISLEKIWIQLFSFQL